MSRRPIQMWWGKCCTRWTSYGYVGLEWSLARIAMDSSTHTCQKLGLSSPWTTTRSPFSTPHKSSEESTSFLRSQRCTSSLLPVTKSLARILKPDEQDDWVNFYVNMQVNFYFSKRLFVSTLNDGPLCSFLDRDMLMRHFGYGVGHMQYERQQDIGLNMVPGGVDSDDDDDASETEEREEQIDDETEDNEESEPSSDDCSHSSSKSDAGGYASL